MMKNAILSLSVCVLWFACLLAVGSCNKKETQTTTITGTTDSIPAVKPVSRMTIIPGKSIGNIFLEQNAETLDSILGKPDLSDAAMGKAWLTWFSKVSDTVTGNELNIYTTYKNNELNEKVVRQVRITSDEFKTSEGLSTGQSLDDIRKVFPNLEPSGKYDIETPNPVSLYDAVDDGIAFEVEKNICVGIIIHEKGKKVSEVYLSFHPDMTPM